MRAQPVVQRNVEVLVGRSSSTGAAVGGAEHRIARRLASVGSRWSWRWIALAIVLSIIVVLGPSWFERAAGVPYGDEMLLNGIKANQPKWIEQAFSSGASANARDGNGETALMWAAADGDEPLVRRLLAAGADIAATSDHGRTPLAAAAGHARLSIMRILIDASADVNQPSIYGGTALHYAAAFLHADAVELLIARDAAVDARNRDGATPLMISAIRVGVEDLPTLQHLIAAGTDVNVADHNGQTALMHAATEGQTDAMQALLAAGADSAAIDQHGQTAEQILRRFLRERESDGDEK